MKKLLLTCVFLILANVAHADGWVFSKGRFPEGVKITFNLTPHQKNQIKLFLKCRNNQYSPYMFQLSEQQSFEIEKKVGFKPSRFAIFVSYGPHTDDGVDLDYNVIVQFDEEHFEIPLKILIPEKELKKYEDVMGWKPSLLNNINVQSNDGSNCPKM
jgi:hypothetical protein